MAVLGLLGVAGNAAVAWDSLRERRAAARARAQWPAQKADLERAVWAVRPPAGWTGVPCDISSASRCWRAPGAAIPDYRDAVLTALRSAGLRDATWTCAAGITVSNSVPAPCHGRTVVHGRAVSLIVMAHLDSPRSRATRTKVFTGVDIYLGADLTPP